ncbi:MAG: glycosyltransferase, partial [Phenylobacterium zucineum]
MSALFSGFLVGALADADLALVVTLLAVQVGFLATAGWRALLLAASLRRAPRRGPGPGPATNLPRYTVLVALFQEAEVAGQLIERLSQIDYPPDRLEGFLLLEADDHETRAAIDEVVLPDWLSVRLAPDGAPRTKPRALNVGLAAATGDLLTVYDAEDDPDPLQLREAAAAFAADGSQTLWAVQAPLRIRAPLATSSAFLDRQFAIEYASLFEVTLPGLARLGLPFPLGGTSNHFRVAALRAIGGWDNHNVTEDADIGFRIWRAGGRLDVLTRPTYEPPPGDLEHWLPQRTRWLKGFMQTWGVHTRDIRGLGWRGGISLTMTLGAALASAAIHALSLAWLL